MVLRIWSNSIHKPYQKEDGTKEETDGYDQDYSQTQLSSENNTYSFRIVKWSGTDLHKIN